MEGVDVAGRRPVEEEMKLGEDCSLHIYLLFFQLVAVLLPGWSQD